VVEALADPRLRGRRAVAKASGSVAETYVVPGGTLDDHGIGIDGLESPQSFDDDGIEVKS
ncbi:hypothetical protein ACC691_41610, partial [Rhizobium johnstonii]|uniref:hypothetical protein n=1 Tax=Rhizobium johnstonii TaxID=3019933 RepID=UPI003F9A89BE